jgi:predicted  nucleic acid-binding Zn-ribbon protein
MSTSLSSFRINSDLCQNRRRLQNRNAQKAFRDRKQRVVDDLRSELESTKKENEMLHRSIFQLLNQVDRLKTDVETLIGSAKLQPAAQTC